MVRHDLKTPLNGIISLSKRLQYESNINNEQRNWVNMINESGQQILHMVEHSLDIYKIEEGTYALKPVPVDITRLFHRLSEEISYLAAKKDVTLAFYRDTRPLSWDTLHWIAGEEMLLANLFSNLIKNAIEASPEKETVTIRLYEKSMHEVEIHNMGIIPERIQDQFFERYVTADKESGTGLGTYSAKLIASVHGGDITFQTSESHGTTLTVKLPKHAHKLEPSKQLEETSPTSIRQPTREYQVLSVDDHPNNHMIMEMLTDDSPYVITYVDSGKEALQKLTKNVFDIILMDLNMPEMNGFECVQKIRDQKIETPIVALSADNSKKTLALCKEKGLNDFLSKPLQSREDLFKAMEQVILTSGF